MKVLIVDDNIEFASTLSDIITNLGYKTSMLHTPKEAIDYLEKLHVNIGLILLDIEFGPNESIDGIQLLEIIRRKYISIPVVMISGKGTIETAVKATKLGAVNFIEKSTVSIDRLNELMKVFGKSLDSKNNETEMQNFLSLNGIIGKSKQLLAIGDYINRFGRTDLNVLITGETGTGKKLVAKAIHSVSKRNKYQFITVDIPNIPVGLFQSELFGHVKGAFSGAMENKKGLFHEANKGTMFLDEIGEMSGELQSNLFIPIEEKLVRKVGSVQSEEVDIRFISATDKDLIQAMKEGKFREQLYHRLRECEINIPPLRERVEDIPLIVDYYVQKHNNELNETKFFSPSCIDLLMEKKWNGNVRELSSLIRVALQITSTERIEVSELNKVMKIGEKTPLKTAIVDDNRTLKEDLADVDKLKIESTLEKFNGNVSKSAVALGVSRETLHNKIKRYGINTSNYRN